MKDISSVTTPKIPQQTGTDSKTNSKLANSGITSAPEGTRPIKGQNRTTSGTTPTRVSSETPPKTPISKKGLGFTVKTGGISSRFDPQNQPKTISESKYAAQIKTEKKQSLSTTDKVDVKEKTETLMKQLHRGLWEGFSLEKTKGAGLKEFIQSNVSHDPAFKKLPESERKDIFASLVKGFEKLTVGPEMFKGMQMTNSFFNNADLSGFDMQGTQFGQAQLTRTKLDGANLEKTSLHDSVTKEVSAKGANFQSADLTRARLEHGDFTGTDFTGATMLYTKFDGSDLSGAKFGNTDLNEVSFGPTKGGTELTGHAFYVIPTDKNGKPFLDGDGNSLMAPQFTLTESEKKGRNDYGSEGVEFGHQRNPEAFD